MTELPVPDNPANNWICQNAVASDMVAIDSDINSAPPTRNAREPYLSTRKPTGVCNKAVAPDINATVRPSCEKLTWNASFQVRNIVGRHSTQNCDMNCS